jgi:hypothetical protein
MALNRARLAIVLLLGVVVMLVTGLSPSAQGGGAGLPTPPAADDALYVASIPDLSGTWLPLNHEDALERGPGPYLVDFTGLALNEEGRALALSTSMSKYSTIERQCALWPPSYLVIGPFGMRIWPQTDMVSGATIAWHIGSWEDRAEAVIWMDGRPRPSANAPHTRGGFETGVWNGHTLTTRTTHVKAGILRRNGSQQSDQTTYTTHYILHGDLLTVLYFIDDPIYLSEVQPISKSFRLAPTRTVLPGLPCVAAYEGTTDVVSHYLPGTNPATDDLLKAYGIPREAALGGAETMYPEYRKKLKDVYVRPERCLRNCGGPRGGGAGGAPGQQAPAGRGSGPALSR